MSFSVVPCKKKRLDADLDCIVCININTNLNTIKHPKKESYETLIKAASRRKDKFTNNINERYNPSSEQQNFSWHSNCYASYTSEQKIVQREEELLKHKCESSINAIVAEQVDAEQEVQQTTKRTSFSNQSCIVCGFNSHKIIVAKKTITELSFAQKFMDIARSNADEVFERICTYETVEAFITQKFKYHDICMKGYKLKQNSNPVGRPPLNREEIINEAFDHVLTEISFNNCAHELSFLTYRVNFYLKELNEKIENRHLKQFLINKYGQGVLFSQSSDNTKSPIVIRSDIPLENLVQHIETLSNTKKNVKKLSEKLKEEIDKCENIDMSAYICDDNIIDKFLTNFTMPATWEYFLNCLLCNKNKMSENKLRRAKSIFMIFCYIIKGIRTPLHVALAQSIHHLTRSKHIINILTKLGYCISYDDLLELDESLTKNIIFNQKGDNVMSPVNIIKDSSLFLHGAMDNNDFLEETINGKNTTHVTTMVLYQEMSENSSHDIQFASNENIKNIDINSLTNQPLENYVLATDKPKFSCTYQDMSILDGLNHDDKSEMIRILSQLKIVDEKLDLYDQFVIPGWTPFQQLLSTTEQPISRIAFCPIITHAPVTYPVVFTAMKNFVYLSEKNGKKYSVLTADMDIYLRAKRIQMQPENHFPNLILRIGSFHLQKNWLRCLGQFLEGCGIDDIISESKAYGEDSIKADRENNLDLHLKSTKDMLPYFFSLNHPLYARGVITYLQDMLNLPETVLSDLKRGMLSVKRVDGTFNGVGGDLALEQTQNRSSAVSGGWVGITQSEKALQMWALFQIVEKEIETYMLSLKDSGVKLLNEFIEVRLIKKEKSIFDTLPKVKVKNFKYEKKSKDIKSNNDLRNSKEIINVQELVVMMMQRGFSFDIIAKHELLNYPKALCDADGFFKKSKKSDLMNEIEKRTDCKADYLLVKNSPCTKIHIIDGMILVDLLQLTKYKLFSEFASAFFNNTVSYLKQPNVARVDIVFDRYDDTSIKNLESTLRTKNVNAPEIHIINSETKIPSNVMELMTNSKNKLKLVSFLCSNVLNYVTLMNDEQMIISGGFDDLKKCFMIRGNKMYEIRIHFWDYFQTRGCQGIYLKINLQNPLLSCHKASNNLSNHLCKQLPALHAFTGCDTTSKICTKHRAVEILKNENDMHALSFLGNGLKLTNNQLLLLEEMYLKLVNKDGISVNDARQKIFSRSCGMDVKLGNIPPTADAFQLHSLRASLQAYIWKNALKPYYNVLNYSDFGYKYNEAGKLLPNFLNNPSVPDNFIPKSGQDSFPQSVILDKEYPA
ncbi:hypothetical protein TKK_0016061 [Trichogramma kaykai]